MGWVFGNHARAPVAAPSDLSRLVEIEAELEARVVAARTEGQRIVQAARDAAAASEGALEAELAALEQSADAATEQERTTRAGAIRDTTRQAVTRLAGISENRVAEIARSLVDGLIREGSP